MPWLRQRAHLGRRAPGAPELPGGAGPPGGEEEPPAVRPNEELMHTNSTTEQAGTVGPLRLQAT